MNVYLRGINRDETTWRDPMRFDPGRHVATADEPHRSLLTFGLGPRGCIGQHLALAELVAVVPALAQHGDVTITGDGHEDPSFSMRVHGGLTGRFTPVAATQPR